MTMTPYNPPYAGLLGLQGSPWSGALSGLGAGLLAAGAPSQIPGWGNFGQGMAAGTQNWQQQQVQRQQMQQDQELFDLRKQQYEAEQQAAAQAQQEQARRQQAFYDMLHPQPQTAQAPARQIGNYGASVGGAQNVQTASGQPSPFGDLTPEQTAFLTAAGPEAGMDILGNRLFAQPKTQEPYSPLAKLKADLDAGRIDRPTYDALVRKETYIAPQQPQQAPATNLITLVGPKGEIRSFDSRDPQVRELANAGWVERDRSLFPAPPAGYVPGPPDDAGQPTFRPATGGPADPNRQTETQRNEFKKQTLALDNLESALGDYEAALDKYGSTEMWGEGKGILENAYANVLIQAKEAAALGALTGPDMEIMGQTIIAPNSMGQASVGGASGVKGQIGSFRKQLTQKRGNLNKLYAPSGGNDNAPPPPPGFVPVQ